MAGGRETWFAVVLLCAAAALKAVLAARWGLLADEAYYAVWSEHLALGYHDQPPLIAFAVAAGRLALGHTELAVRFHAVLAGLFGALVLLPHAGDRTLHALWWVAVPPLAWLTLFGTPDALLLGCWAGAVSAGLAGGRWWLVAGICAAAGIWAKYPALAVLPLLWVGTGDWRDRWMWAGSALAGLLVVPHVGWLITNDAVSVRFQLGEGLFSPSAPGWTGPFLSVAQQVGVLTPFVALAVMGLWRTRPVDRVGRVAFWTSAPLVGFFLLASVGGPPEAHWMAPAWIGAGLGLTHVRGRLLRLAWFGAGTGLLASAVLVVHAEVGVFRLKFDPADRLREGRALGELVGAWSLPAGVGPHEPGLEGAIPVRTERYQEAALIWWNTGIDARKQPGCGRVDQYDRWVTPELEMFQFVRPKRSGDTLCTDAQHPERSPARALEGRDLTGRVVGQWDLFEVGRQAQ